MPTLKLKRNTVAGNSPTTAQLVVGELALNTEDGYLYAENNAGTVVNRIGTTSERVRYLPAGTGAVATTVQGKLRESVSVKDFGAVGDGTTNDSAAFQACIDSLPMGGRIYVPTGNYRILTTLNLHSGLSFYGDSCVNNVFGTPTYNEQSSHIFLDADAGKLFTIPANTQIESIYFTDLSFSARLNPTIVPRGTVTGFHFEGEAPYGMKHFGFTRCEFSNFGGYAIRVYDPTGGTGIDWNSNPGYMDECTFYYNTIGIEFDTDNADYWRLTGVGFIGAAGSFGIMCRRVGTLVLNQCGGGGGTMIAYIGAARDSLTLICCQFEAGDYMIHLNDTMATLQTYMPITLISCVVESPILLNKPCHLISQGTRWVNNLEVTASGVVVDMLFDSFLSSTAINLAAGSYVKNFLTHGSDLPIGVAGTILDGYRHSGPRIAGASPIGVTAPLYIGEEYYDNVAGIWYKGSGTTVNAWAQLN